VKRRQYLALAVGTFGLAGCSDLGSDGGDGVQTPDAKEPTWEVVVDAESIYTNTHYPFELSTGDQLHVTVTNDEGSLAIVQFWTDRDETPTENPYGQTATVETRDSYTGTAFDSGTYNVTVFPDDRATVTIDRKSA
jgi:hypothetical protein